MIGRGGGGVIMRIRRRRGNVKHRKISSTRTLLKELQFSWSVVKLFCRL